MSTDGPSASAVGDTDIAGDRLTRVIAEFPDAAAVLTGPRHTYRVASPAYIAMVGGRPLIGRTVRDAMPELGSAVFSRLDEVYETGRAYAGTGLAVRWDSDGDGVAEDHRVDVSYQPLLDEDGASEGIVVFVRDRTEHYEAERALRESEAAERRARAEVESLNTELRRALAELEAVLDVVPIGIGIARDPECREIRVNPAFARQLGVAPHDDASKTGEHAAVLPFRVVKDGKEVSPDDLIMQRAARERRALLELEYDIVHDDGKVVSLLQYAAPLLDEGGDVQGVVGAFVDITERARLIAAERAARRAAEQANAVKAEFLARMSHELRTPLNAIQGHAQLLTMGVHGAITEAQRDALQRIERAERHLLSLINDVLNYARLESGRLEYQITDVRVRDVLADVVPMVEQQFSQAGITLHIDSEARRGEDVVRADREKLTQVMLNLLSNAAKFTPSGGDVHVEIVDREDGGPSNEMLYLRVRDTGTGIARDKLETIFEPFVQLRGVYSPGAGGTGLGLTISRDLARGMGGDLRARSQPGQGATFTVALRRAGPARAR